MRYSRYIIAILILTVAAFSSCKKDEEVSPEDQRALDETAIQKYLDDRDWQSMTTPSGLHYIIEEEGNGVHPVDTSMVTVNYTGKLTNGAVFDESTSGPVTFPLNGLIEGWQEGLPYFSAEGSGILLVPSHLGYGTAGSGSVPPNSVIIFEIDLLEVD